MKQFIIFFFALVSLLHANIKEDILSLYQTKQYTQACRTGFLHLEELNKDENFIALYAFACLKADYIDRLSVPISKLKYSKEARANSAYLAVILMQKNFYIMLWLMDIL